MLEFWADLRKSVSSWRRAPMLPLLAVALIYSLYYKGARYQLISLAVFVIFVGYYGTERQWYVALWRGENLRPAQVWGYTWAYFRRFFGLGVIAGIAFLGLGLVIGLPASVGGEDWRAAGLIITSIILNVGLTFVTPMLAFSTSAPDQAVNGGLRLLRETWPRSAPYALLPPLVLIFTYLGRQPWELSWPVRLIGNGVAALWLLACKGATAAFYLREIGRDPRDVPPPDETPRNFVVDSTAEGERAAQN